MNPERGDPTPGVWYFTIHAVGKERIEVRFTYIAMQAAHAASKALRVTDRASVHSRPQPKSE